MNEPFAEERKVAVMLVAMQDMHQEIEAMLGQMQAAVSHAQVASQEITRASQSLLPTIEKVTHEAVDFSVQCSLEDLAEPATRTLQEAITPVRAELLKLAQHIAEIERRTRRTMAWFSWKWIALAAAGFTGVGAVAWGSIAWQRNEMTQLMNQRNELTRAIEQMQATVDTLGKKGAHLQLAQCGGRLCVIVNRNQGEKGFNWRGPWRNEAGQSMVIPLGY